jgi:thymidylate kinase
MRVSCEAFRVRDERDTLLELGLETLESDILATDRSTPIGQMIDSYLKSSVKMDDHVIHLLFSANRWEAV